MTRIFPFLFLAVGSVIFSLFSDLATASQVTSTPLPSRETLSSILSTIEASSRSTSQALVGGSIKTLAAAILLQWTLTHWKEMFHGDLTSILAKSVGLIMWFGAGFWLINNQDKFYELFNQYLGLARNISGIQFDPVNIWSNGIQLQADLAVAFYTRNGDGLWEMAKNIIPGLGILVACLLIVAAYGLIALSVLVAIAEFWLMMSVAPFAIAMIGLTAFRDQGFAPIKGLMSVGLRIIILSVIIKTLAKVHETALAAFRILPADEPMTVVWYVLGGVFACAVMALYSGKIASGIASGSASFSGSDAIRGGMAMAQTTATAVTAAATGVAAVGAAGGAARSSAGKIAGTFGGRSDIGVAPGGNKNLASGGFGRGYGNPPPPPGAGEIFKSMGEGGGPTSGGGSANSSTTATGGASAAGGSGGLEIAGSSAPAPGQSGGNTAEEASRKSGLSEHVRGLGSSGRNALAALAEDNAQVVMQINTRGD